MDLFIFFALVIIVIIIFKILFINNSFIINPFGDTEEGKKLYQELKNFSFSEFGPNGEFKKEILNARVMFYNKIKNMKGNKKLEIIKGNIAFFIYVGLNQLNLEDIGEYSDFSDYKKRIKEYENKTPILLEESKKSDIKVITVMEISKQLDYLCINIIISKSKKHIKQLEEFTKSKNYLLRTTADYPYKEYLKNKNYY